MKISSVISADPEPDVEVLPAPVAAKKRFVGSPQQGAFWAELRHGRSNVVLEARAGTGKSSSCRQGMSLLLEDRPSRRIRYCCFNKAIADEFQADCPERVEVGTMHRFGLEVMRKVHSSRIDETKGYTLLDGLEGGRRLPRWERKAIVTLVSLAKNHGLRPDRWDVGVELGRLLEAFAIEVYRSGGEVVDFARRLLLASLERADVVDFDDMLWIPALEGLEFPAVDFLFIDEAQDLNPVQHELVMLMGKNGRVVVVGDPLQAIYGWRGAMTDSMESLRGKLDATVLPLTVTWRCPRSHVELVNQEVPDLEAAPDAIEGHLEQLRQGEEADPGPGSLILCRNNAPLVHRCLGAVMSGRRARMRGRAIGRDLVGVLRTVEAKSSPRTRADMLAGIARWRAEKLEILAAKEGVDAKAEEVDDQAKSLEAIAHACDSPAEMVPAITQLFSDDPALGEFLNFSSVHRAKGSEANEVVYHQVPYGQVGGRGVQARKPPAPWELDQRRNLRYVALTRSRQSLTLTH